MTATDTQSIEDEGELQIVEFYLGDQAYCVAIDQVFELVDMQSLTKIPDSDPRVMGIVDLRGETTRVIDPREPLEVESDGPQRRILIFDDGNGKQGDVGWVVDQVTEVRTIKGEHVEDKTTGDFVQGLIKDGDDFILWVDVEAVNNV